MASNREQQKALETDNNEEFPKTIMEFFDFTASTSISIIKGSHPNLEEQYSIMTCTPNSISCMKKYNNYKEAVKDFGEYVARFVIASINTPVGLGEKQ